VVKEQVRIIDIMPTILDLLGLEQSPEALGESLVPLWRSPGGEGGSRPVFCEVQSSEIYMEGLRTEKYKIVRDYRNDERRYFDLVEDPGERVPRMSPERDDFKMALNQLFSVRWELVTYKDTLPWRATDAPRMDPELRERLKSLGYIKDKKDQ
jgi:arylsulfatase A-like enzyme